MKVICMIRHVCARQEGFYNSYSIRIIPSYSSEIMSPRVQLLIEDWRSPTIAIFDNDFDSWASPTYCFATCRKVHYFPTASLRDFCNYFYRFITIPETKGRFDQKVSSILRDVNNIQRNLFCTQKIDIHKNGQKLKRNYFDTTIYYLLLQIQRQFNNQK